MLLSEISPRSLHFRFLNERSRWRNGSALDFYQTVMQFGKIYKSKGCGFEPRPRCFLFFYAFDSLS